MSLYKTVLHIVFFGFVIGYLWFHDRFMEWFWSVGYIIYGLLGAPIVLGGVFYLLLLVGAFYSAVWFYRHLLWG